MKKYLILIGFMLCSNAANAATIDIVNKTHTLTYHADDGQTYSFKVAVGKPAVQVHGSFVVGSKIANPSWTPTPSMRKKEHMRVSTVPPGPHNPLGPRILHLARLDGTSTYYGIHGNNNENSIGKSVSHGCIRMHNSDIRMLYNIVPIGTIVNIR